MTRPQEPDESVAEPKHPSRNVYSSRKQVLTHTLQRCGNCIVSNAAFSR